MPKEVSCETVVLTFNPIDCPGCGMKAAIPTIVGETSRCECGVEHLTMGVIVRSSGQSDEGAAHKARHETIRAARVTP
jgi:hypothetical protein